jgi:hypothetical protein
VIIESLYSVSIISSSAFVRAAGSPPGRRRPTRGVPFTESVTSSSRFGGQTVHEDASGSACAKASLLTW